MNETLVTLEDQELSAVRGGWGHGGHGGGWGHGGFGGFGGYGHGFGGFGHGFGGGCGHGFGGFGGFGGYGDPDCDGGTDYDICPTGPTCGTGLLGYGL